MYRRKVMKELLLIPLLFLGISCESNEFSRATEVSVKVIDQAGIPLSGAQLLMYGEDEKGIGRHLKTFSLDGNTNISGEFMFSQNIPKKTDRVYFLLKGNDQIQPFVTHNVYYEDNGVYVPKIGIDFEISRDNWGKSISFNLKYEKI